MEQIKEYILDEKTLAFLENAKIKNNTLTINDVKIKLNGD